MKAIERQMVSVVVPLYNGEEYIERCLQSIIDQTYENIEILVVNDGSSDSSLDLVMRCAQRDTRIKVFTQENEGVSAARNLGIEKASGVYICFVDADDYIDSTMIEKLLQISNTSALGVCNFVHNDSTNKILCKMSDISCLETGTDLYWNYLNGQLGTQIAFSAWNKLFSMQIISEQGLCFPRDLTIGEDLVFVLRYLCYAEQIQCVDEGLYHYWIRQGSTMHAASRDYLQDYDQLLKTLSEFAEKENKIDEAALAVWSMTILTKILINQYVEGMCYSDFRRFHSRLCESLLARYVMSCKKTNGLKQTALLAAIKSKNALVLFLLIKMNRLLHTCGTNG